MCLKPLYIVGVAFYITWFMAKLLSESRLFFLNLQITRTDLYGFKVLNVLNSVFQNVKIKMIFELHIVKFYFRLWELSNYKWFNLIYVVQLLLAINLILSQVLQKHGSSQKLARFEIPQAVFLVRFYRKFTLGP